MTNQVFLKIKKNYGGLPQGIYILFLAQVINRVGGFVYGFLTLYMSIKLHYTPVQIADFVVLNAVFSMVSPFLGGAFADKKGRKKLYILANGIGASIFILCGIATNSSPTLVPYLLIIASIFFNLTGPIANAMVADLVPEENQRKRAYALIYLGINLGVAIGPILGGFLLKNYVTWFFIGDAMTTIIGLILIALFVKETLMTKEQMEEIKGHESYTSGNPLWIFLKRPILVLYTIFSLIGAFVYAQHNYGLSLHLNTFFIDSGAKYYGALMSFNAIIVLLFTLTLTELMSKLRTIHSLSIGALFYAFGFGILYFAKTHIIIYVISVFMWTLGEIIIITHGNAFVMSNTPVNLRGRFSAIIGFIIGTGYVISPKIISYFLEQSGFKGVWITVGLMAFISAIGYLFTGFIETKKNFKSKK
ncbi:MAG: MFS transporter [Clostridia bacterium]|nr:MFS transporter [Clostridia bacterium]